VDSETIRIGRDRLLRVFRYLEALNEHRNPVKRHIGEQLWTQRLKNLPDHPSIRKGASPAAELPAPVANHDGAAAEQQDSDFILKIARSSSRGWKPAGKIRSRKYLRAETRRPQAALRACILEVTRNG
jgi:hypothetical protein